jgi:hypothetical protein
MTHMTRETPDHVNPIQWQHAIAVSRQSCARFFCDGGSPADAVAAYGIKISHGQDVTWDRAVDQIANELCAHPLPRAA